MLLQIIISQPTHSSYHAETHIHGYESCCLGIKRLSFFFLLLLASESKDETPDEAVQSHDEMSESAEPRKTLASPVVTELIHTTAITMILARLQSPCRSCLHRRIEEQADAGEFSRISHHMMLR